jgi:4-amino-4-deoxy-L-arabinose transferase-like glycosyltransferase
MYSESLATPLTVALLILALTARPTRRVVLVAGGLLGVLLLVRPTGFLVVPAFAIAWSSAPRRGLLSTAAVVGIAVLFVVPWSIRNASVDPDHFVPISVQDAAGYGVFNDDAAHDSENPWKWRPVPARDRDLFDPQRPVSDGEFRAELQERSRDYIADHPSSLPKAWWHNGVVRLWDLVPPSDLREGARFGGLTPGVTVAGLAIYWVTLVLGAAGLWVLWRSGRRRVVIALAAVAVCASVVFTSDAGTRYRAPFEPVIAALAAGGAAALVRRRRGQPAAARSSSAATS